MWNADLIVLLLFQSFWSQTSARLVMIIKAMDFNKKILSNTSPLLPFMSHLCDKKTFCLKYLLYVFYFFLDYCFNSKLNATQNVYSRFFAITFGSLEPCVSLRFMSVHMFWFSIRKAAKKYFLVARPLRGERAY